MDPLTLFALANGAVAAVKKGCELYKEMSGAIGDVKGVLQDLEEQFNSRHKDKPPTVAEKNQYIQEKNRVIELSKKQPDDVYMEVANYLGEFFENMAKCEAVLEEEERHSSDVYTGSDSIGKRALQRVLMQTKLTAMQAELREIMVYQMPPEMGDLYTRVEKMMVRIKKEQTAAIATKMQKDRVEAAKRRRKLGDIKKAACRWTVAIIAILYIMVLVWSIVEIRKAEHPELGVCLIPKGQWPYEHYNNLKWVECEPR
jgi:hypothetical protein